MHKQAINHIGQNKNVNANLDQLLKEYLERIDKTAVPADDGTDEKTQ